MESRIEESERRTEVRIRGLEGRFDQLQETIMAALERMEKRNADNDARGGRGNGAGNMGNGGGGARNEERSRRVEVPYFTGEDPYGWLFRAERYFRVNQIPMEEQVEIAAICLEGKALSWFQWWEPRNPLTDWGRFRSAILERFHTSMSGNPYDALMSLRQSGTVVEFREQFETLVAPLQNGDDEVLKAAFMAGLKENISAELRVHCPGELGQMMNMAQRIEEKEAVLGRINAGSGKSGGNGFSVGHWGRNALGSRVGPNIHSSYKNGPQQTTQSSDGNKGSSSASHTVNVGGVNPNRVGQTEGSEGAGAGQSSATGSNDERRSFRSRRLSQDEYDDHRRKNLCFRCDAPYAPGHVCQSPQLSVLILGEGCTNEDEEEEEEEIPVKREAATL